MPINLDALFRPLSVAFVGGSNLDPALRYHRDLGFAGDTWVVNPKYKEIQGYTCFPTIDDLPHAPDLAFVAIRREAAIETIAALRDKGCKAVVCNAAGFAETGEIGGDLQARLVAAAGDMIMLGPNAIGVVNFADPVAVMMDHFGVHTAARGVAICSQGGGFLCDAVFSDRGLAITHMVGGGNQAVTGLELCLDYLLDDPRVTAVGLSFEALRDIASLRRAAAKALRLGKPIVAIKFGKSEVGAMAAASHTASMTGAGAAWEALFDRLGIVSTNSESEFFETLKLFDSGQIPKGRRVMVTAVSGVMGVMLADHLSAAGFELPQPTGPRYDRLRAVLPAIATPCNPQDVTMAAWNDLDQQTAIYSALLDEGYDVAMMIQNYPREGMWDVAEYEAQVAALGAACAGRDVAALQLAPMVDCFPGHARDHTQSLGLAAMQGLEECIKALSHAVWWQERRAQLIAEGLDALADVPHALPVAGIPQDEARAKALISQAGISVPRSGVVKPAQAAEAAQAIGFPVAIKALDARLLHKTEVGAVRIGLASPAAVDEAIVQMRADMARLAPHIPLNMVLVEAMATDVVAEVMASVAYDPSVGPVMMIAGGGIEAELWNDSILLAAPFPRAEIARALDRLKVNERLKGWRGRPAGDREALLTMLEKLAQFALTTGAEDIEVNPILVGQSGALAVDAVLRLGAADQKESVA
ncbi:MAG: acetate--CoA ligase family protein [Yoonia sp.]|uniref:acetate--CoA ligase family protein n=1 Tax=Yoonia sp. TaxID=2212373 RepID=UPI00273EEAFB|nr:acetate--CoA ligase family protein [Yoonia sp.]MDP5085513.1 acetate--CoA ligase family protein [Yoonia sp.]